MATYKLNFNKQKNTKTFYRTNDISFMLHYEANAIFQDKEAYLSVAATIFIFHCYGECNPVWSVHLFIGGVYCEMTMVYEYINEYNSFCWNLLNALTNILINYEVEKMCSKQYFENSKKSRLEQLLLVPFHYQRDSTYYLLNEEYQFISSFYFDRGWIKCLENKIKCLEA